MSPAKYLLIVAAVVGLILSVCEVSGDDGIPSKCEPSCQQLPPPATPVSGYPSYGAPPPPPPSGYSIYSAPPSPPKESGHIKCPPPPAGAGVQCCPPPFPYTYAPPYPYTYAPPNPYTYVPYGEGGRLHLPILATLVMIFSSFIFLF